MAATHTFSQVERDGIAVGTEPSISVLGVLTIDGSAESVVALMTTSAKVTANGHRLGGSLSSP